MNVTVIAGNGIGGTEKAAYLFAVELQNRGYNVTALTDPSNCRFTELADSGVTVKSIPYDKTSIRKHLLDSKCEIVHQHTPGYADQRTLYGALDDLGSSGPKLIETNVFGRLMDRHDNGHVSMRMFVSMASGCQAFARPMIRKTSPSIKRHTILYNPLPKNPTNTREHTTAAGDGRHCPTDEAVSFRKTLDLSPDDFLFVRVGRPGHKWVDWECEAFQIARRTVPNIKLILMEPPSGLRDAIRQGAYGEGIVVLDATSDQEFIDRLYRTSDAMLHASRFGESYGYTLAEGMRAGLPIITRTTPWADNAQVELVKNGETGMVCCSIRGMAHAVVDLVRNSEARTSYALGITERIKRFSDLGMETDLLEQVMKLAITGNAGALIKQRFENWSDYMNNKFTMAEWDVYERNLGWHLTPAAARFYNTCRIAGSSVKRIARNLSAGFTARA